MPIFPRHFWKTAEEGTLLTSFYKAAHSPDTQTRQRHHQKENHGPVSLMKTDTKILNKVLSRFYNKHIDSGALWRRRESEVEEGLGGARGLSVSTGSVNFPPGPRPPAHTLQPSPCEWSISSPCRPERLCVHRQELVQERSKDLSNQLLSEDVPGLDSRASPLFSWGSRQTVPPESQAAEQTVSLCVQVLLALGFWRFPILSHFLFQAAQSPGAMKSKTIADFLAVGVETPPPIFHTLCF